MTTTAPTNTVTSEAETEDKTKVKVEKMEVTETTTTTTTVKTVTESTTVTSNSSTNTISGKSDTTASNGAKIIKITPEMSVEIFKNANSNSSGKGSDSNTQGKSDSDKKEEPKSTIMNVQSLVPNVKPTILKVQDDSSTPQKQTRTVLIVNRDGNKVTLAVSKQSITPNQNTPSTAISISQALNNAITTVSAAGKTLLL